METHYCSNCGALVAETATQCSSCHVQLRGKGTGSEEERRLTRKRYRAAHWTAVLEGLGDTFVVKNWKEINYAVPAALLVIFSYPLVHIHWLLPIAGAVYVSLLAAAFSLVDLFPRDEPRIADSVRVFFLSILVLALLLGLSYSLVAGALWLRSKF